MDPVVAAMYSWVDTHQDEILDSYRAMLRIPSLEDEAVPNGPFGQANRDALDLALKWCADAGMKTTDLEGYIGYGEIGSGENLVAAFGHLDVVPVGPGWKHEPFGAEIDGEYVYARGAIDDKGPSVAAFFACRALMECFPNLKSRVRMVFGCNEESGFGCIEHYAKVDEHPTYGFAPDAGWPLIHAEKGIANFVISRALPGKDLMLKSIKGGQRPNIVIDSCDAIVGVSPSVRAEIETKVSENWDRNLTCEWHGDDLHISAIGKAAHVSWPWGGDNAAIRIFRFLMEIAPVHEKNAYEVLFDATHIAGSGIGIDGRDDITNLTCNLGILWTEGGRLKLLFNVRYPVTWKGEEMRARCEKFLADDLAGAYVIDSFEDSPSLYFPLEHPLVKVVCDVYARESGETKKPGVMGGGTYARAVSNTVAIGTGWEGDGDAHQTDERCKISSIYRMTKLYAEILYRLSELG